MFLSNQDIHPPHLVSARLPLQVAEYENCRLLLVDKKITTARDIVGILELSMRGQYPLMIMAEDIEQEPLATLVVNKLRGNLKVPLPLPSIHPGSCQCMFIMDFSAINHWSG